MRPSFGSVCARRMPVRRVAAPRFVAQLRGYAQVQERGSPIKEPMKLSGALKGYNQFLVTPTAGTEFTNANLTEWVNAPNSDELLRDLAITVARRGVVFFRKQNDMTTDVQKKLIQRMGELTGKPSTSTLHIHPVLNPERDLGGNDLEISTISSRQRKSHFGKHDGKVIGGKRQQIEAWHSDIQLEPVPSDFTCLRLSELPSCGGDTLWASGYEVYDRLSPSMQKFLEQFTANYDAPFFTDIAKKAGLKLYDKARGSPENIGEIVSTEHPVVRTNPVTGWKSIFALGAYPKSINGLSQEESEMLLNFLMEFVYRNHDLQVRFRWQNPNDMAIWDNRSMVHNATLDYDDYGERFGYRVCGIGEKPYFDPNSMSRREALKLEAKKVEASV
ncbi:hypothetical protein JOL62DRAFT_582554 [Phyllosticta paracitricarpa]|uniref:TauD/TfdA-like domain-containing protein n=2 Tax=Phyllosticta TaxID=121621 RepID=A0ABR1MY71_9PEZI